MGDRSWRAEGLGERTWRMEDLVAEDEELSRPLRVSPRWLKGMRFAWVKVKSPEVGGLEKRGFEWASSGRWSLKDSFAGVGRAALGVGTPVDSDAIDFAGEAETDR